MDVPNNLDVHCVVRGQSERTLDLCKYAIKKQGVNEFSISELNLNPFENALKKMIEVASETKATWLLAIDADTIMIEGSIQKLVKRIQSKPQNTLTLQGLVHDRVTGNFRPAGHRIYNSQHLASALFDIPKFGEYLRPETEMISRMESKGFKNYTVRDFFGFHDYEQYYLDLYAKSFNHGLKHRNYSFRIIHRCLNKLEVDTDFHWILMGFIDGYSSISIEKESLKGLFEEDDIKKKIIEKVAITDSKLVEIFASYSKKSKNILKRDLVFNSRIRDWNQDRKDFGFFSGSLKTLYERRFSGK